MSECDSRKQLEKLIEEQQFAISQISHEIRNPVTLINSSLQLIEKEHPEVNGFAFWKETMQDMKYLIRLLDEVSGYNNGEKLHSEMLPASEWLLELAGSAKQMSRNHHTFTYEIPKFLPNLYADPIKLRQAITNLLRNAFEAVPEDGQVLFSAAVEGHFLKIVVRDTGCGIPNEYLDTLFQPFVTHKATGTGLGLPIAKRIVEAHKGTLQVYSRESEGTIFTILLPL